VNPRRRDFFPHRRPTYVAFDLLIADGVDLLPRPLKRRRRRFTGRPLGE
jgi:ATP-dependent DNA ligase